MSDALWPYLVIVVAGFLPNEAFRLGAILLSNRISESSELFTWIRYMATTLLAAVVSRLIYAPAAALSGIPLSVRIGAIVFGVAVYFASRRSLALGIAAGEAAFVGAAWWLGAA